VFGFIDDLDAGYVDEVLFVDLLGEEAAAFDAELLVAVADPESGFAAVGTGMLVSVCAAGEGMEVEEDADVVVLETADEGEDGGPG